MQNSAWKASGRREERVPLATPIELRSAHGDACFEADALNVSIGGLAVRADFVPPLGAVLECRFGCPPYGDLVCAPGEVIWSADPGPHDGCFGLRFLELDTKSATALRRYLAPELGLESPSDRLRGASLLIDGLDTPIEAELKLADETRVVLEQQLSFLQLGRGVEVSVLGRGRERGRIASVELRHTHFDVPTLVFGILLDDAPERAAESVDSNVAPLFSRAPNGPPSSSRAADREPRCAARAAVSYADEESIAYVPDEELAEESGVDSGVRMTRPPPRNGRLRAWFAAVRARLAPSFREHAESLDLLDAKTRLLLHLARVRGFWIRLGSRLRRGLRGQPRRLRPPPLRVQRSTLPGTGSPEPVRLPTNRGPIAAGVVAACAVGFGVYAVVPLPGADLRGAPAHAEPAPADADALTAEQEPGEAEPALTVGAATSPGEPALRGADDAKVKPMLTSLKPAALTGAGFGARQVPNARTFTLRMNGPVRSVTGSEREDGFTVRVPGRLSLDRASPIAASHRAIARAMILNRGGYAELTIDFVPGLKPRYQVQGRDNTLEVTLERL